MAKSPGPLVTAYAVVLLATCSPSVELVKSANAQELPVPCYAFYRDFLGQWIAAQPVEIPTRIGILNVRPGQVGNPVAEVLNAYCRGGETGGE